MRILVTDGLEADALEKLKTAHEVDAIEADPKALLEIIPRYEALVVRSRTKVTAEVLGRAAKLRVVGRAGIGVDNIDVRAATARRIPVVNAPTGSTISVAELAIGHMLSLARQLPEADRSMKEGKWEKKRFEGRELHGKVLGLVGSGRIGAEVARRAQAFGMDVVAFDPYLPSAAPSRRRRGRRPRSCPPGALPRARPPARSRPAHSSRGTRCASSGRAPFPRSSPSSPASAPRGC